MKALIAVGCLLFSAILADAPTNLLKPANQLDSWRVESTDGGKCTATIKDDAIVFDVTEVDSTDWHVQAVQTDLDLKDGTTYVLRFKAMSPENKSIAVNAMIDEEDWHQIGLQEESYLGKEYREVKMEFRATDVIAKKNRISFVLGQSKGTVHIKDLSLTAK